MVAGGSADVIVLPLAGRGDGRREPLDEHLHQPRYVGGGELVRRYAPVAPPQREHQDTRLAVPARSQCARVTPGVTERLAAGRQRYRCPHLPMVRRAPGDVYGRRRAGRPGVTCRVAGRSRRGQPGSGSNTVGIAGSPRESWVAVGGSAARD